ncbi:tail fiber assembly protein [Photorhabdus hainanensis]|uniref:tail fiber assembly protein n=1 Tax=Photorhabdus hainanensis TaxID=1004166 RepID=UPI001BD2F32E|nr:tail fiber assembly protein [Photorhabdus hainanensis]MBS9431277.1 tail fiber assembly protein [Photorhabdus hainanensis]
MIIYFLANPLGFYSASMKQDYIDAGSWPENAVEMTAAEKNTYWMTNPPEGKRLGADNAGRPVWVDIPPPTPEQLQQRAESQKRQLLDTARAKIDIYQDAVDLDMATDAEKSALTAWRKYRVLLNRVDCATAPDIQWPEQPK